MASLSSVFAAAVVEGTIFCAHAGLSPQLYDLDLVSLWDQKKGCSRTKSSLKTVSCRFSTSNAPLKCRSKVYFVIFCGPTQIE